MRLLVDMNLSPGWCDVFKAQGWECVHWSTVGDPRATDRSIMEWAGNRGYVVFTHDLDFGALLAAQHAAGPSVVQVRAHDVLPENLGPTLTRVLKDYESELDAGSIVTVDEERARIRMLPIRSAERGEE